MPIDSMVRTFRLFTEGTKLSEGVKQYDNISAYILKNLLYKVVTVGCGNSLYAARERRRTAEMLKVAKDMLEHLPVRYVDIQNNGLDKILSTNLDYGYQIMLKGYNLVIMTGSLCTSMFGKDVFLPNINSEQVLLRLFSADVYDRLRAALEAVIPEVVIPEVAGRFFEMADNDPCLLEYFDRNQELFTYGLQSTKRIKPISQCIRDNAYAFNYHVLNESSDYRVWTSLRQASSLGDMERRYNEQRTELSKLYKDDPIRAARLAELEEKMIYSKKLFDPRRLLAPVPGSNHKETLADHYIARLNKLYQIISLGNPPSRPLKNSMLDEIIGRHIKSYIRVSMKLPPT